MTRSSDLQRGSTITDTVIAPAPPAAGRGESHIPRDCAERPLVGLCGCVARSPTISNRQALPGEHATCVVCEDMWNAGVRSANWP